MEKPLDNPLSPRTFLRTLLSLPLRVKITVPYLVVATLLAGLAIFQVSRSFVATLEQRFRTQLSESAERAADGIIELEERHLVMLRTISFTVGIPEAVADQNAEVLSDLILPQIVNNQIRNVEVLDASGAPIATWHYNREAGKYIADQATSYPGWSIVRSVLALESDALGDKFSEIVETPWGWVLYTAGALYDEDSVLGAVLIGTPIDDIILQLNAQSLAGVSIYNPAGNLVRSSLFAVTLEEISLGDIRDRFSADVNLLPTRRVDIEGRNYIEAIEPLYLRGFPSGWYLGLALPESLVTEDQGFSAGQLVGLFAVGVLALIGLGVVVAQIIAVPVFRLVEGTRKVGLGALDVQLDVVSDDEIGVLTQGFNDMVVELQQREYVHEMFGRMVSEAVREAVLENQVPLGGETKDVAVLFIDVRGFTYMAEQKPPAEVVSLLNDYFSMVAEAAQKCGGMINHFGGDSALVVFGAPITAPLEESTKRAVMTASQIRIGLTKLNASRISSGILPFNYGIGINSGPVIAGNIGSADRFEYTVIGDVVNIAARMQALSHQFSNSPILISGATADLLKDNSSIEYSFLGEFALKGKEELVQVFGILEFPEALPEDFDAFDGLDYPACIPLLASYLHCLEYSPSVIAETLDVTLAEVQHWLAQAQEYADIIADILVGYFGLSPEAITCLQIESSAVAETQENV